MEADLLYLVAAEMLVMFHFLFIVFVVAGGLLVLKRLWVVWLHVPAAIWGAVVEINGWICVLTPWENELRKLAGQEGYSGGFIEHYIAPIIYPSGLTHEIQVSMGVSVIIINIIVYGFILYRRRWKP
jgi:hypothetical protein